MQAPVERRIIKQCLRERSPYPDRIAGAPSLNLGLELYFDAFWDLSSCRGAGWSVMPIPWGVVRDYATTFELDEAQQEDLFYLIRVMDNAFLEHHDKGKKSSPSAATGTSSKGGWT